DSACTNAVASTRKSSSDTASTTTGTPPRSSPRMLATWSSPPSQRSVRVIARTLPAGIAPRGLRIRGRDHDAIDPPPVPGLLLGQHVRLKWIVPAQGGIAPAGGHVARVFEAGGLGERPATSRSRAAASAADRLRVAVSTKKRSPGGAGPTADPRPS